nr:integrase, catalytic region, zinc finger, CCHC-type, peptidase aspartic, catalytic [Tanacetum cinerariifolium]
MSRNVLTVASTMRIPLLYQGEYSQWVERFMNCLEEQTDGEAMINCIKNGDQPLPRVTQVSIAGTSSTEQPHLKDKSMWSDQEKKIQRIDRLARSLLIQGLSNDIYSLTDSKKTAKDLWIALARHMLGSEYGLKKKTVVVTSDPLALIAEKTKSANKKQEFVKADDKKVEKKDFEKKRDMSKVKCYNCKKEVHFAKDCKKVKVKDYEYYKTKIDSDQEINANMVFMAQIEKVLLDSETSPSSADDKISKVSYYLSESENKSEYETSEYYDNTTTYVVDHNDSEGIDKLIRKFSKKIAKCLKRIEKANQQNKDFKNQNKDLQVKYDVLKNQATTFEMTNKELNEQLKVLIEKNNDLLAQTNVLKDQLQVKHVVIDTHVECQEKYAKLKAERYEYMIRYSAYFDNDKQHRKRIADQEVLYDKMSVQLVELDKHKKIIIDLEDEVVSFLDKEKENLKIIESLKSNDVETGVQSSKKVVSKTENKSENVSQEIEKVCDQVENSKVIAPEMFKLNLDTFSSVRKPQQSNFIWKKKWSSNSSNVDLSSDSHSKLNKDVKRYCGKELLSCNNSHLRETSSAYDCNDTMNVSCNSRLCDSFDENNLFIFDDESVRISPVSKMPFRKKPCNSLNMHSKHCLDLSLDHRFRMFKAYEGNHALLTNFVEKFLGTVRFGNNDFTVIAGYGDVVIGSMTIKKVYYVEGLGHNLFSVGQFCDKGLEVAFRKSTCFVRNEDGMDLLTGDRLSNLYTISLNEVASNSL